MSLEKSVYKTLGLHTTNRPGLTERPIAQEGDQGSGVEGKAKQALEVEGRLKGLGQRMEDGGGASLISIVKAEDKIVRRTLGLRVQP